MNTTSPARSARFRAVRRGLYVSVALAIGTVAVPSFAQSTGSAQANDLQGENQALRTENELLRQRLAALGGGRQLADASLPTQLTVANSGERQAFLAADANDDGGERGAAGGSGPDIVVTADGQKGPAADLNALKDVPKSIAVITPAELKIFDQVSLPDALSRLGNVRWNDGNSRTGSFSLRGLTASAGSDTIDPSVGLVIDGVPYASLSLGDTINLLDIEQINVTKGPQGTTGARQTSVGQINIINRHPSFTPEGSASLTVGQNSALRAEFEGGGPIIEDLLAFRITAMRDQRNGNWWNSFVGVKGLQSFPNVDRTYGRAQLLFTPTKDLSVRLQYDLAPNGNEYINGLSFGKPTPLNYANGALVDQSTTAVNKLGRRWFTQQSAYNAATDYYSFNPNLDAVRAITTGGKGALSDVEWNFGKHTFSWIASWRSSYFLAGNDDGTPFDITKDGGFITTYEQFTSEAKLQGELGDGLLDYTTGLFFLKSDSDSLSRTRYGGDAGAYNTNATQYNTLDANAAGRLLMGNALNRLYVGNQSYLHYLSKAAYAQLDWHVSNRLTLTTGFRFTREKRKVTQGITPLDQGYGVALNPVSVGNVQLGGFNSTASGALAAGNSATQIALANSVAAQYFNVATYSSLTAPQLAQVAAAKALRQTQLGTLYNLTVATPWEGNLYTGQLSLRNEFSTELTAYATLQYGEKPGISLFNGLLPDNSGPRPLTVAKERTLTYELGLRANVLDGDLVLNADIFRSDIWNFQQSVYFFDPLITALRNDGTLYYTSGTGNVPRVRSQGLEAQLSYSGIKYATFRVSGAYTDAKYVDYQFAGQPSENANLAVKYRDISGHTLPNAPKVQFNATATYRRPVLGDKLIHASAGYTYTSKQNGDSALSAYGVQHAYGIADLSLGFGREDGLFDINLIVRNLFDEKRQDAGWSSITIYQKPRWIGVSFSSKFL
jgi:outer membrane receptor protein involved in Fe transport